MDAQPSYLPLPATLQFVAHQPGASQKRQAEEAQRYVRSAVRSSGPVRFLSPASTFAADDLIDPLRRENPTILYLWLPEREPATKAANVIPEQNPADWNRVFIEEGRELGILLLQNTAPWGWEEDSFSNWAPVVVWSIMPVDARLWGYFLELWLKVLSAGMSVLDAYEKAIEGLSSDFPEAREALRISMNPALARERLQSEPQIAPLPAEEVTEEAEETDTNPLSSSPTASSEPPSRLAELSGGAHSDQPTLSDEKDWLGYRSYAQIIAQIIQDPDTEPPLSIAVIGPWGQGKSSLMRMIQRRVGQVEAPAHVSAEDPQATATDIEAWIGEQRPWRRWRHRKHHDAAPVLKEGKAGRLSFPTVWFNPWEYQSSEQIWSGMAHAIISQLVAQLPRRLDRERFWLDLHLERIDRQGIRQRLYRDILFRVLPYGLTLLLSLVAGAFFWIHQGWEWGLTALGSIGIPSIWQSLRTSQVQWEKGIKALYDEFLKPPTYDRHLGVYHEVNEDLARVFRLLVDRPAVIFIDDLDRCSPEKVVEVVEAINLLMNARFRDKCYFVIGMDAEMVAAALDVQYHGMKGKFPGKEKTLGSVGWYFLDKFIQVPVVLPTMRATDKTMFLEKLFSGQPAQVPLDSEQKAPDAATIKAQAKVLLHTQKLDQPSETKEEIRSQARAVGQEEALDQAVLEVAYAESEDAEEIRRQVREFAHYLDPSPRSIKRFANLLRFYTSQQRLRETKSTPEHLLPSADTAALAKWLIITLRWPLLVRWIQWREDQGLVRHDGEAKAEGVLFSRHPEEKARALDQLVSAMPEEDPELYWQQTADANRDLPWLADQDLYRILTERRRPEEALIQALACGVW